jgi:hypothetical protein
MIYLVLFKIKKTCGNYYQVIVFRIVAAAAACLNKPDFAAPPATCDDASVAAPNSLLVAPDL